MRMNWKQLLSPERVATYGQPRRSSDLRSEFEKDYHRIIGSSSFRRLQDKTQVFALDKSDFIRTRLTHSLEVSSFAKSLGQNVSRSLLAQGKDPEFTAEMMSDVCDILQCAGLIHDIGNPPFGHFGEEAIRDWFVRNLAGLEFQGQKVTDLLTEQMQQDLYHFEGNAQALRQVTRLHFLVNEYGMNLTYALLNTIIKYPVPSTEVTPESSSLLTKKMGFFHAEEELYHRIASTTGTEGCRHPLTFLLEAADDIAYLTADIEDAFKKGFLSYDILSNELKRAQDAANQKNADALPTEMLRHQLQNGRNRNAENPALYAVQNFLVRLQSQLIFAATESFLNHYEELMHGEYVHDLFYGTDAAWIVHALGDIAYRYAFTSPQILRNEVEAGTILDSLLDRFVPSVLNYDTEVPLLMMQNKLVQMISENYRQVYHIYSARTQSAQEKLYLRLLLVTDFVSGMTDSYAKDLYQKIYGIS